MTDHGLMKILELNDADSWPDKDRRVTVKLLVAAIRELKQRDANLERSRDIEADDGRRPVSA